MHGTRSTGVDVEIITRRCEGTMARPNFQLRFARSPGLRYGFAATSSGIALGFALLAQRYDFLNMEAPLFLLSIAVTVWYAGIGPAILAVILSSLAFDYFFTEPRYTFYITRAEFPHYVVFILFAVLLSWFSKVRKRVEQKLLQSRDELQIEVVKRTEQASLLNLTHDTIFVRDMSDIITYWNRGAEELYGWLAADAIGSAVTNSCRHNFRYRSKKFARSCCVQAVGKVNFGRPKPTDPGWW